MTATKAPNDRRTAKDLRKARKDLSAGALFRLIRSGFERIQILRAECEISSADAWMSAFAMFSLKDPSLLAFDQRRRDPHDNFRTIYGIEHVPCDTQMRSILDPAAPDALRPLFKDIFRCLQRGKALESYVYFEGHYLVSLDGTTYFSSGKVHCPSCLKKQHRNGSVTYFHQVLAATLVHPQHKEVIPLAPEPIIVQDGDNKNDCEQNATRRWLKHFRQEHPHLPVIVVEDALSANAPHLRDLREANVHYIIGVKPGSHGFLFDSLQTAEDMGLVQTLTVVEPDTGVEHRFRFLNQTPLNKAHPDELVHVLDYYEIRPKSKAHPNGEILHFTWITDFTLTPENVAILMRGGRTRWKIENETFNTMKNQGYHLEHNYGHGDQNLSTVLMMVMMLAFLVDQTQQLCCPLFQAAWKKRHSNKRSLWEEMRNLFHSFLFDSMEELWEAIARGIAPQKPVLLNTAPHTPTLLNTS